MQHLPNFVASPLTRFVGLIWVFSDGRQTCDFILETGVPPRRILRMPFHGVMSWKLTEQNKLQISNFPLHEIERCSNWYVTRKDRPDSHFRK